MKLIFNRVKTIPSPCGWCDNWKNCSKCQEDTESYDFYIYDVLK